MGAWGNGPFDNDAAADLLDELQTAPARRLTRFLKSVTEIPEGEYIEIDYGGRGWAACELVALSFGYGDMSELRDAVIDVIDRLKPEEEQRLLALSTLARIASGEGSELAALWHEGDEGKQFNERMQDLRRRLEAASDGPKQLPGPKRGDIIYLRDSPESSEGIVLQVVRTGEVAVFEGKVSGPDAAQDAIASRPARRLPAKVNKLLLRGQLVGNTAVRKDLRGKKLYAREFLPIVSYTLTLASGGGSKPATYSEAREYEKWRCCDTTQLRAAAAGDLSVPRVRSPDEREAQLYERHGEKWEERRRVTTPGPFGDIGVLEGLLKWIEDFGLDNAVQRYHDLAHGLQGYGRPDESAERRSYAFVGIVAVWRGSWPKDRWPEELADRFPRVPDEQLFAKALTAARLLVDQVLTRDSELRLIWDAAADGGASFRTTLAELKRALE